MTVRLGRFAASRRRPATNNHNALSISQLLLEKIDQAHIWIEADDARCVGHEVRQRVDIVESGATVALVDDVFDAADIDAAHSDNFLDRIDQAARWCGWPYS